MKKSFLGRTLSGYQVLMIHNAFHVVVYFIHLSIHLSINLCLLLPCRFYDILTSIHVLPPSNPHSSFFNLRIFFAPDYDIDTVTESTGISLIFDFLTQKGVLGGIFSCRDQACVCVKVQWKWGLEALQRSTFLRDLRVQNNSTLGFQQAPCGVLLCTCKIQKSWYASWNSLAWVYLTLSQEIMLTAFFEREFPTQPNPTRKNKTKSSVLLRPQPYSPPPTTKTPVLPVRDTRAA
jgi:hypothetical protein